MMGVSALVLGILTLNAFLGLQILGLTYRPFSWMTICEAGETTLYPVFRGVEASSDRICFTIESEVGTDLRLERTASLSEPDWQPVGDTVSSVGDPVLLRDTNPPPSSAFYRVEQTTP